MATVKNFEDLEIWKMARENANLMFHDLKMCREYAFKDQLMRASISIMNNIAEGFHRNSDAEFRNFLNISKGSAGEVKSMLYLAEDMQLLTVETATDRRDKIQKIINSIASFMSYLKK
jgi:four helix bundle protein